MLVSEFCIKINESFYMKPFDLCKIQVVSNRGTFYSNQFPQKYFH